MGRDPRILAEQFICELANAKRIEGTGERWSGSTRSGHGRQKPTRVVRGDDWRGGA